jgi:hypothetical protein
MVRAAALTLLVISLAMGCAQAQRGVTGGHGFSSGGSRSGFGGHQFARGFSNRGEFRHRRGFSYPYYWYDYPYDEGDYERPYSEVVERQPAPVALPPAPPNPPAKAQVIEIPAPANSIAAKPQPPAVFILTDGEHVEASRFVLTAHNLSVTVNRHQRTIPLDQVDLDATLAVNRDRGIDLRVPADQNEISLSF